MAKIGFVGLGHMGLPMAINLVGAGHEVWGFDLQTAAMTQLEAAGGNIAPNLSHLARDCKIIITMLQTGQQVLQVFQGEQGLLASTHQDNLFIDCSTIDVESTRALHQLATDHQSLFIDAPVSGGTTAAAAATLTFMVGGTNSAFQRAEPLLHAMGRTVIYAGQGGSGQAAKICNNMILGISMIAISEAFVLAEHLQLTPKKLFEVVSHSSGQCWAMNQYVPVAGVLEHVPANQEYQPGFAALMMLKDLRLSQEAASLAGVTTPLASQATALYQKLINEGMGALDFSAIIKLIHEKDHHAYPEAH